MAAWISVAIGLVVALLLIGGSIWWSFRPRPKDSQSRLPEARESTSVTDYTVITGTGSDA
jgi:hypothetical protein